MDKDLLCILTNEYILTGNLINFYKSENIYKDIEQHGIIPTDVANCVRWAFGVIGQSSVLYDPRIRLCKDLKKPEFCRVLRNRLWTVLKENMMIYLESNTTETKDYIYSQILSSLKDINNRFLRRRQKTKKRSGTPRMVDPGKVSPENVLSERRKVLLENIPGRRLPGIRSRGRSLSPRRNSIRSTRRRLRGRSEGSIR